MIYVRETNPYASYRKDGSPAHEWDYRELRDQLDERAVTLGQPAPIPQFPTSAGSEVSVYVNHGRWLFDCPTCQASYLAAGTKIGFCTNCWNAGDGYYRLTFPADRLAIEHSLECRPDPSSRNWLPGESVKDLNAENVEHLTVAS